MSTPKSTSHIRLGSHYLNKYPNTIFSLGEWYRYNNGIWEQLAALQVRKEIQQIAVVYSSSRVTNSLVSSVYALLQASTYLPDSKLNSNIDIITFADCTLEISTGITRGHSPDDYVTSKLPFNYDPTTRSEIWDQVLSSTNPEYLPFIQEFAGYCLTASTRHELALWNWGDPGSGKSTFIAGLETMLGSRCCILGLADIERSAFALSQIPGKTLAISTEQPSHFIRSAHILNALISGEPITWERKFKESAQIRPRVKIVWAMNELPRIDSSGVGLFRRIIPLHWRRVEKPDPTIKEDKIPLLGQQIFNWAFEGLQRLNQRGRFVIPASLIEERETYRTQNDIPKIFVQECCEIVPETNDQGNYNRTQASTLYSNYRNWCEVTNHKSLSSTTFGNEISRLGFKKATIGGKVYYLGILLKPTDEFEIAM